MTRGFCLCEVKDDFKVRNTQLFFFIEQMNNPSPRIVREGFKYLRTIRESKILKSHYFILTTFTQVKLFTSKCTYTFKCKYKT